ncbi:hypothetical protein DUI87_07521 [Hirundo rustica rustica]|uniref:Reverse transcriptase domain-containing protein n=1 Tax=Hirundo rustica rustica TaxID=333673 RepID=A0A3M0KRP5_HIRRU|nr:hypothetical protein DUI87_07521 [Hirundo rustica rustica]
MAHMGKPKAQHEFKKGRYFLTNLIFFYDQMTCLVDDAETVDVVHLDFSKVFYTIFHGFLLEELAAHVLDRSTLCWVKNELHVWAQRLLVKGAASTWWPLVTPGNRFWA